jgi:hypothetical protein
MTRTPRRPAFRPQSESLESRNLMAVFTVTKAAEVYGIGTLNWAINQSNHSPGPDVIRFQIPVNPFGGPNQTQQIVPPPGGFPTIMGRVTIDGFTQALSQPNTSTNPLVNNTQWGILLQGTRASGPDILTIGPGGSGSEIRGVVFGGVIETTTNTLRGVTINRANNVKIDGDGFTNMNIPVDIADGSYETVGGDVAGTPALQNVITNYSVGVYLTGHTQHNAIFGNGLVAGQPPTRRGPQIGVWFQPGADHNSLVGNILIGNSTPILDLGTGNFQSGNIVFPD